MNDNIIDNMRQSRNDWIDSNRLLLESFPKTIAESWMRSHALGVEQTLSSIPKITQWDIRLVTDFREQNDLESMTTKRLYRSIASFCDVFGMAVALANESLRVFDLLGNEHVLTMLKSRKIELGSNFSESSCGANAMCLAKETGTTQSLKPEQCYSEAFDGFDTASMQIASNPSVFAMTFTPLIPQGQRGDSTERRNASAADLVFQALRTLFIAPKTQVEKLLNEREFGDFLDECGFCAAAANEDLVITAATKSFIETCRDMELAPGKSIEPLLLSAKAEKHALDHDSYAYRGSLTTRQGSYQVRQYSLATTPPRFFFALKQTLTLDFLCNAGEASTESALGEFRYLESEIKSCAQSEDNVLIVGEDGTGKARLARAIHLIHDDKAPYFSIDCRALGEEELTGALFGGFDPISGEAEGALDKTRGGTLFLSSIESMPASVQARLADAISSGRFLRPHCLKQIDFRTRIIASTEIDPGFEAHGSTLVDKLRFQIDVTRIDVAPLRERKDDFEAILDAAASRISPSPALDREAKDILAKYDWPGNTAELENTLAKLRHLFGPGVISAKAAQLYLSDEKSPSFDSPIRIESPVAHRPAPSESSVRQALEECGGNKTLAARMLQVSRQSLYNYIKRYGIA